MADSVFRTYSAIGNREDLTDIITDISPTDTPMLSSFGKTTAKGTYHEWQTDTLSDAAANSNVEGSDEDADEIDFTTRTGNYTQILRKSWRISNTQQAVDSAGRPSEYNYQMAKAMKELARDIEYALVNGTANSGDSGTARTLQGVLSFITTNVNTGASAVTTEDLSETVYNNLLQTIYDEGGNPDTTYANGWQKRKISAFSTSNQRNISGEDKRLINSVDVYESDFGLQRIILDRYMTTSVVACLQNDLWKVATLRPVAHTELPNAGGGPKGLLETELTMESLNEAGSGKITELTTS